ncbi:hypothetical protein T439DRAFT_164153 [Meredithblackwellia eburnea MCA 4105]
MLNENVYLRSLSIFLRTDIRLSFSRLCIQKQHSFSSADYVSIRDLFDPLTHPGHATCSML